MTKHQPVKRRIRARMAETGERYTTARLHVVGRPDAESLHAPAAAPETSPGPVPAGPAPASDPRVLEVTGRDWPDWYALLDAWGAAGRTHRDIARWLREEHGVPSWWSQELTVRYERASGRRQPGQQADGFTISVTRTIGVPVGVAWDAWMDGTRRATWLPDLVIAVRRATPPRTARFDVDPGPGRLLVTLATTVEARTALTITHERLPDAAAAADAKAAWAARLDGLRAALEG